MKKLDIGDVKKLIDESKPIKDRRNTLFPVENEVGLEFKRLREQISIPIGVVVYYYGDHNNLPYGWKSIVNDLRLSKADYQNLYLALRDTDNVTEEQDYFTVAGLAKAIIRVI